MTLIGITMKIRKTCGNNKYSACRSFFFTEKELVKSKYLKLRKLIE